MLRESKNDQNHSSCRQKSKKTASIIQHGFLGGLLAVFFLLSGPVVPTGKVHAASNKQIMKECRKRYGSSVKSWYRAKSGKIICVHGAANRQPSCSRQTMDALKTHQQRLDFCRKCIKGWGPLTLRRRHGKWWCVWSN